MKDSVLIVADALDNQVGKALNQENVARSLREFAANIEDGLMEVEEIEWRNVSKDNPCTVFSLNMVARNK